MKPLISIQQMLIWVNVRKSDEFKGKWEEKAIFAFFLIAISFGMIAASASSVFFTKFISIDIEASLAAIYPVNNSLSFIYVLVVAYLMRHKIDDIFDKLSNIYDTRK